MPGSRAEDILGDYFEADDWAEVGDAGTEPELDLPPLPTPGTHESAA
jgi:hypothetical protein